MHEAQGVCHHWLAHVMPLYALLFPGSAACTTQFILRVRQMPSLRLAEDKAVNAHMQGADMRSCGLSNDLGTLYLVPGTCMPYVKDLQQEYMHRYNINLSAALEKMSKQCPDMVGPWILHWTRLLATCVQLQSVLKVFLLLRFLCYCMIAFLASFACMWYPISGCVCEICTWSRLQ